MPSPELARVKPIQRREKCRPSRRRCLAGRRTLKNRPPKSVQDRSQEKTAPIKKTADALADGHAALSCLSPQPNRGRAATIEKSVDLSLKMATRRADTQS